ncbi:FxLYD domain-containing protein [Lyngbya sp. CCY1209]|uniref:FxLYD domain-containing protein n=1 Tax=Lyngbya sp. CCY1209 TaxID=2886103 RepID=UPI002D1FD831|nr:FxLYD domain-containing protein [Lyngbya sp. CCY1209]MEB3886703.1 FxLYD domain-containing protein [Lyngbya sp. CCY1209]
MNPENISISEVEDDGKILRGTVVNKTCNTLRNLRVNYQVFDGQNNPIDNGFIAVDPAVLEPGAIAKATPVDGLWRYHPKNRLRSKSSWGSSPRSRSESNSNNRRSE